MRDHPTQYQHELMMGYNHLSDVYGSSQLYLCLLILVVYPVHSHKYSWFGPVLLPFDIKNTMIIEM